MAKGAFVMREVLSSSLKSVKLSLNLHCQRISRNFVKFFIREFYASNPALCLSTPFISMMCHFPTRLRKGHYPIVLSIIPSF